jgi:hypothetical protein
MGVASGYPGASTSTGSSAKERPAVRPAGPTSVTSPTASSDACGRTNRDGARPTYDWPLDKGASDSPRWWAAILRLGDNSAESRLEEP